MVGIIGWLVTGLGVGLLVALVARSGRLRTRPKRALASVVPLDVARDRRLRRAGGGTGDSPSPPPDEAVDGTDDLPAAVPGSLPPIKHWSTPFGR